MGKLFLLVAPSGSGKSYLAEKLINDGTWIEGISHTSRSMREGERDEKNYYFKTKDEMLTMISTGKFVEHVEYDGNYYGISKAEIERGLKSEKPMFIIVEFNGYKQIKEKYPEAIGIFLHMSKEDCMANMLIRGDGFERATKRINSYDEEIKNKKHFDYVVKNVRSKEFETTNILKYIVNQYIDGTKLYIDGNLPFGMGQWNPNTIYSGQTK